MRSRLDRLFARFRKRGDARALAKVFDAAAPELYRVATHLSKDLHAAEDLVQSTFLAAIVGRESWDESRGILPWLIGILARQAAHERRQRARTIDAQVLERSPVPEPAEHAEAQELSAELLRAIDGVAPPYREVLLAHLKQGKTPQEIARDLGRAPGTVRVQLHRALEKVRKSLPAGLATGGVIAALSPRGLSAVRAVVVRSASMIPAPAAAVATPAVLGGWIISTKAIVAISSVAVGLVVASRWAIHSAPETHASNESKVLVQEDRASGMSEPAIEELAPVESERVPLETRAAPEPRPFDSIRFRGSRVSGYLLAPDGSPAADAYLALVRMNGANPTSSVKESQTDANGAFVLEGDPGSYLVVGLRDACLPLVQRVALDRDAETELPRARFAIGERIGGHVRILGVPAPRDCQIQIRHDFAEEHGIELRGEDFVWSAGTLHVRTRLVRTDDLGRFVFEGLDAGPHTVSLERTPEQRVLHASVETVAPIDDVALDVEAVRLILRVRSDGQPVESHVALHENGYGGSVWGFGQKRDLDILVPCGSRYVVDVDKEGYASAHFDLEIPASSQTIERTVELVPRSDGADLAIELVTPDGRRIQRAGFGLFGTRSDPPGRYRPSRRSSHGRIPDVVKDLETRDGLFRLENLPPDRYRIEVVAEGTWARSSTPWYADPAEVELGAGDSKQVGIELHPGGRIRVQCLDRKGNPLSAACRVLGPDGVVVSFEFFVGDERGSVWTGHGTLIASAPNPINEIIPSLPPGTYRLDFSLHGYHETSRSVVVEAGTVSDVSVVLDEN